jgi:HEAT repeat protein
MPAPFGLPFVAMRTFLASIVLAVSLAACAAPSAMRPARSGDLPALKAALEHDLRAGRLTRSSVKDLAQTLAARELSVAQAAQAVQRIQQVRPCARHLQDPLSDRAKASDPAASDAALILLEAHLVDLDQWRSRAADPNPGWRAAGVRGLVEATDGERRRAAMVDADENVRLAAVRAAEDARDRADLRPLAEAARLDPNALVRVTAVRALGQIGAPASVHDLKDLWAQASEPVRQAIVVAWSWPGLLENGGKRELLVAAETAKAEAAILASGILVRLGPDTRGPGVSGLVRHIQGGTARERALAIALAPWDDPDVKREVKKASAERDPEVKLAALTRLARDPAERPKALDELGSLAASGLPVASKAKTAMARLGDARVTALLVKDGESKVPEQRLEAVRGLLDLGDIGRAAMSLADPDVGVRTRAACEILVASERW